jgi:ribosomal protein S18 acetylase RimI-like enzyme
MEIEIRPARKADIKGILKVIGSDPFGKRWDKPLAEKYYKSKFNNICDCYEGDEVLVGVVNKKIIAVIGYCPDRLETKRSYWLGWFYVHKDYRDNKYGKTLLRKVINELKGIGAKKLFVDTSSDPNYIKAVDFYLKNGFKLEAVLRDYYGKGEDQLIFGIEL